MSNRNGQKNEGKPKATSQTTGEWKTVDRLSYVGKRAKKARQKLDDTYGSGSWRIAYQWGDTVISRDQALEHYAKAYEVFFAENPDELAWLTENFCDVYDIAPEDVESGTNFHIQRPNEATHLQDIAIRIAVEKLGETFKGEDLLQVRSKSAKGAKYSPGRLAFHEPDMLVQPEQRGWWKPGSIESFWQSNKILQVRSNEKLLIFGGSFNPIHSGHMAAAYFAVEELGFDKVIFIPNGPNYKKRDLAPAEVRLEMVKAAVQDANHPAFEVYDAEVHSDQSFRGVETAYELRELYPNHELYLFRGIDSVKKTHRDYFTMGCHVLVFDREEGGEEALEKALSQKTHLSKNRDAFVFVQDFQHELSATAVRKQIKAGETIHSMVPDVVASIIKREKLYL